ncbi:MAG TPA: D-glycero-beta-D-manno-heptose 1,7-bisphosphate 7-phosphatase [Campylobacterales bacterium]|nr:D-glycero-beta-D-manno-heptose 1,7-bisphosphate 7-phosphatase [Campylobacterales bacterium]
MNKTLFLDRDGVINKEKNYLYKIEEFEFINGVFETCRYFQKKGYIIIIITNQAGIARKKYTEEDYKLLTNWMITKFELENIKISKVYHCPHHPDFSGECDCRKPNIGMLLNAQKEFDIDMNNSILIGDKNSDIEAGINAKIGRNYLINTGHKISQNKFNVKVLNNLRDLLEELKLHNKK